MAQTLTTEKTLTDESQESCQPFNEAHERFIDWYAAEGQYYYDLETHKVVKRTSLSQLSRELGVSRQTLYEWPSRIPNFEARLANAKRGIIETKIGSIWNAMYLSAIKGDSKAIEMFLINFDPHYIPIEQVSLKRLQKENNVNWAELLSKTRRREEQANA